MTSTGQPQAYASVSQQAAAAQLAHFAAAAAAAGAPPWSGYPYQGYGHQYGGAGAYFPPYASYGSHQGMGHLPVTSDAMMMVAGAASQLNMGSCYPCSTQMPITGQYSSGCMPYASGGVSAVPSQREAECWDGAAQQQQQQPCRPKPRVLPPSGWMGRTTSSGWTSGGGSGCTAPLAPGTHDELMRLLMGGAPASAAQYSHMPPPYMPQQVGQPQEPSQRTGGRRDSATTTVSPAAVARPANALGAAAATTEAGAAAAPPAAGAPPAAAAASATEAAAATAAAAAAAATTAAGARASPPEPPCAALAPHDAADQRAHASAATVAAVAPAKLQGALGERVYYQLRLLMLQQQEVFVSQLWDLHRLHRTQRRLGKELLSPEHEAMQRYRQEAGGEALPLLSARQGGAGNRIGGGGAGAGARGSRKRSGSAASPIRAKGSAALAAATSVADDGGAAAVSRLPVHVELMRNIPSACRRAVRGKRAAPLGGAMAAAEAAELEPSRYWVPRGAPGYVRPLAVLLGTSRAAASGDTTVQASPARPGFQAVRPKARVQEDAGSGEDGGRSASGGDSPASGEGSREGSGGNGSAEASGRGGNGSGSGSNIGDGVANTHPIQTPMPAAAQLPQGSLAPPQPLPPQPLPAQPLPAQLLRPQPLASAVAPCVAPAPPLAGAPSAHAMMPPTVALSAAAWPSLQPQPPALHAPPVLAAPPMFDPHAYWFNKHYGNRQRAAAATPAAGAATAGVPPISAAPPASAPAPAPAPAPLTGAAAAAPPATTPLGPAKVVRWWTDAEATFGPLGQLLPAPERGPDGMPAGNEATSAMSDPIDGPPMSQALPPKKRARPSSSASEEPPCGQQEPAAKKLHRPLERACSSIKDRRAAAFQPLPRRAPASRSHSKRASNRTATGCESIGSDGSASSHDDETATRKQQRTAAAPGGAAAASHAAGTATTAPSSAPATCAAWPAGISSAAEMGTSTAKSAAGILLSLSSSYHP